LIAVNDTVPDPFVCNTCPFVTSVVGNGNATTEDVKKWLDTNVGKVGKGDSPYETIGEVMAPGGYVKAGKNIAQGVKKLAPAAKKLTPAAAGATLTGDKGKK